MMGAGCPVGSLGLGVWVCVVLGGDLGWGVGWGWGWGWGWALWVGGGLGRRVGGLGVWRWDLEVGVEVGVEMGVEIGVEVEVDGGWMDGWRCLLDDSG